MPIHNIRVGGISVAIWENTTKQGVKYPTISSPVRTYKDGDQYKTTPSLRSNDVHKAIRALEIAYDKIMVKDQSSALTNKS